MNQRLPLQNKVFFVLLKNMMPWLPSLHFSHSFWEFENNETWSNSGTTGMLSYFLAVSFFACQVCFILIFVGASESIPCSVPGSSCTISSISPGTWTWQPPKILPLTQRCVIATNQSTSPTSCMRSLGGTSFRWDLSSTHQASRVRRTFEPAWRYQWQHLRTSKFWFAVTEIPAVLNWAPIILEQPDWRRPQSFGRGKGFNPCKLQYFPSHTLMPFFYPMQGDTITSLLELSPRASEDSVT